MYKRILVPTDGSITADLALKEAIALAKDQDARLLIIHIADPGPLAWDLELTHISMIREALYKAGLEILEKAEDAARETGVELETRLIEAERVSHQVTNLIIQEAEKWLADLIVMGTHGRKGLEHLLMGSVAEGVVRSWSKPVLLIRNPKK